MLQLIEKIYLLSLTYNVVERRRRDKINTWINRLAKLVPNAEGDHSKQGQVVMTCTIISRSKNNQ